MAKTVKDRTTRKQKNNSNNSNNSLRNVIPSDLLVNTITNRIDLVSTVHNMTSTLIDEYVKKNVWKNLENLIDSKISKAYEDQKEQEEQEKETKTSSFLESLKEIQEELIYEEEIEEDSFGEDEEEEYNENERPSLSFQESFDPDEF